MSVAQMSAARVYLLFPHKLSTVTTGKIVEHDGYRRSSGAYIPPFLGRAAIPVGRIAMHLAEYSW